jgi:hypothetical protein
VTGVTSSGTSFFWAPGVRDDRRIFGGAGPQRAEGFLGSQGESHVEAVSSCPSSSNHGRRGRILILGRHSLALGAACEPPGLVVGVVGRPTSRTGEEGLFDRPVWALGLLAERSSGPGLFDRPVRYRSLQLDNHTEERLFDRSRRSPSLHAVRRGTVTYSGRSAGRGSPQRIIASSDARRAGSAKQPGKSRLKALPVATLRGRPSSSGRGPWAAGGASAGQPRCSVGS